MNIAKLFLIFSALLLLILVYTGPVFAQDAEEGTTEKGTETTVEDSDETERSVSSDKGEEEDPFKDILGTDEKERNTENLEDMRIEELDLRGIAVVKGKYIAYVIGVNKKGYILREEQKLFDGYVKKISANEIIYMLKVEDPVVGDKFTPVINHLHEKEVE